MCPCFPELEYWILSLPSPVWPHGAGSGSTPAGRLVCEASGERPTGCAVGDGEVTPVVHPPATDGASSPSTSVSGSPVRRIRRTAARPGAARRSPDMLTGSRQSRWAAHSPEAAAWRDCVDPGDAGGLPEGPADAGTAPSLTDGTVLCHVEPTPVAAGRGSAPDPERPASKHLPRHGVLGVARTVLPGRVAVPSKRQPCRAADPAPNDPAGTPTLWSAVLQRAGRTSR